jgi:hypothetical protein
MKKLLLLLLLPTLLISCKKEEIKINPRNITIGVTLEEYQNKTTKVYINNELIINQQVIVYDGDYLRVEANGTDGISLDGIPYEGFTALLIRIDSVEVYNQNCNCNQLYEKQF